MNKIKYKMGFDVKNTTYFGPLDLLCPYSCQGCGCLGTVLCGRCKKYLCCRNNLDLVRKKLRANEFDGLWGYSTREGVIDDLIKKYKYQPMKGVGVILAEMLDEAIPCLDEVIVVPLPTIAKHIRQRGFDHAGYLAKKLARRRGWGCRQLLIRLNDTVQVGSKSRARIMQAEMAYRVREGRVEQNKAYLLVDDVWTTGASMRAAARELRRAGVKKVYGVVVAVSGKV